MEPTELIFVAGLLLACTGGMFLRLRGALLLASAITATRYALAVATWGFDGPNDESPAQYAAFAVVAIAAVTLGATAAGALIRLAASAATSARRSTRRP